MIRKLTINCAIPSTDEFLVSLEELFHRLVQDYIGVPGVEARVEAGDMISHINLMTQAEIQRTATYFLSSGHELTYSSLGGVVNQIVLCALDDPFFAQHDEFSRIVEMNRSLLLHLMQEDQRKGKFTASVAFWGDLRFYTVEGNDTFPAQHVALQDLYDILILIDPGTTGGIEVGEVPLEDRCSTLVAA